MDTTRIEEKFTGIEAFVFDTIMGLVIMTGWLLATGRFLLQPKQEQPPADHTWDSRTDFRQSGFQPQRSDVSGVTIAVVAVVAIVATLIALYPHPL